MIKAVVGLTADRPAGSRLLQYKEFPTKIAQAFKETFAGFKATAEAAAKAATEPPAAFSRRGFGN